MDLVHEIAGLARVEPLADHRPVADGEPDEHVEVLGALAARRGGQQPAVGGGAEADLSERLVGLGGRVDVAQRLVGDQQMPRDRLQVGGVAVQQPVRHERDAGTVPERAVEGADLAGDGLLVADDQHLDVGRQRCQSAAGRSAGELVAPLAEQPALGDDDRAEPSRGGRAVRERAAGRNGLAGTGRARVNAGADDLQRGHLALAAEQHGVVGQRPRQRHPHHLTGAGVERDVRAGTLERAQLGDRLFGDDSACAGGHAVGGRDRQHAGAALHPPDADGVLELAGRLGGQQQRQSALDRGLHRLAEVHRGARLRVGVGARHGAEPALREPAGRERDHAQRELRVLGAVAGGVCAAGDEQPAPPVAFVARRSRPDARAELA